LFAARVIEETRAQMYEVQEKILAEVGIDRLNAAGELGVLRLMMKYSAHFFQFLEIPEILSVIDATVSSTAIMHLQNGFILPSLKEKPEIFQTSFHQDFPRVLNGYLASINVMVCIDDFTEETGATLIVPGSHQRMDAPNKDFLKRVAIPVRCPAGSIFIFDSTLWHAAGDNVSGKDRLAINHQFTRSFIKQQIDYVRALGEDKILRLPARTQQLLGYYTRTPASLNDFYQAEEKRLYRRNQG
jgi:ectoine hydroxylase-related dioxygenase (phytanoyl-CoA dioxygenase family)